MNVEYYINFSVFVGLFCVTGIKLLKIFSLCSSQIKEGSSLILVFIAFYKMS